MISLGEASSDDSGARESNESELREEGNRRGLLGCGEGREIEEHECFGLLEGNYYHFY